MAARSEEDFGYSEREENADGLEEGIEKDGEVIMEVCDFCWDDEKKEVPAVMFQAGIPLCKKHADARKNQTRFATEKEEEEKQIPIGRTHKDIRNIMPKTPKSPHVKPDSLAFFKPGGSEEQFAAGLGTLLRDVLEGKVEPAVADTACKVADKIIKVLELRMKLEGLR